MSAATVEQHLCGADLLPDYEGHCTHCDFPCSLMPQGVACTMCVRMMQPEHLYESARFWVLADQFAAALWDQHRMTGGGK